jgi:hypothetical protein
MCVLFVFVSLFGWLAGSVFVCLCGYVFVRVIVGSFVCLFVCVCFFIWLSQHGV